MFAQSIQDWPREAEKAYVGVELRRPRGRIAIGAHGTLARSLPGVDDRRTDPARNDALREKLFSASPDFAVFAQVDVPCAHGRHPIPAETIPNNLSPGQLTAWPSHHCSLPAFPKGSPKSMGSG